MEKETVIKVVDISTDMIGVFCPPIAAAKILIKSKDLIFKKEIEELDPKKLEKMLKNENFVHLLLQAQDACRRSKEDEKARFFTKFFRTIVDKEYLSKVESDELEEFIYLFSSLSFREILTLHKIREVTMRDPMIRVAVGFLQNGVINFNERDKALIEKYSIEFSEVLSFLISAKVQYPLLFLKKLEGTGLIKMIGNYSENHISTLKFEKIYKLSDDLEDYLNECINN